MSTSTKDEMIYLIPEEIVENLRPLIIKVHKEYGKYKQTGLRSAISRTGGIEEVSSLYSQLQELFFLGDSEGRMEFISFDFLKKDNSVMILDYDRIREAKDYAEVMFEIYTSFAKMEMRGFSKNRIADSFRFFLKIFCEKEECEAKDGDIWELLEIVTEECAAYLKLSLPDTKDGNRMKHILYSIYENI